MLKQKPISSDAERFFGFRLMQIAFDWVLIRNANFLRWLQVNQRVELLVNLELRRLVDFVYPLLMHVLLSCIPQFCIGADMSCHSMHAFSISV